MEYKNSLVIDPREPKADEIRDIKRSLKVAGIPHIVDRLSSGDFMFLGFRGKDKVVIRVERKKIHDMASSVRSKRLSHQIAGMLGESDIPYLLIEGRWRRRIDGAIEHYRFGRWVKIVLGPRPVYYDELFNFSISALEQGGVRILRTEDHRETADAIAALYKRWQKPKHTSLGMTGIGDHVLQPGGRIEKRSFVRHCAAGLDDVRDVRAVTLAKYFRNAKRLCNASEETLVKLLGPKRGVQAWNKINHNG